MAGSTWNPMPQTARKAGVSEPTHYLLVEVPSEFAYHCTYQYGMLR